MRYTLDALTKSLERPLKSVSNRLKHQICELSDLPVKVSGNWRATKTVCHVVHLKISTTEKPALLNEQWLSSVLMFLHMCFSAFPVHPA